MARGTNIGNIQFTFRGNAKPLTKTTKEVNRALGNLQKQSSKKLKDVSKAADKSASDQIKALRKVEQAQKKAIKRARASAKGGAAHGAILAGTRRGGPARSSSMRSGGRVPFARHRGGGGAGGGGGGGGGAGGMLPPGFAGAAVALGAVSAAFTAAAAAARVLKVALIASVDSASKFEEQFMVVQAITTGTVSQYENLENAVIGVSKATEHSNVSLLQAAEVLGRAGFKADDVGQALETVADLATAGGMSVAKAANLSVRMLKSFGMAMDELPKVSNMLAAASANANVSIQSLGEGFKFAGAIAETSGLSFSDVTTSLSLLGETGLEAGLAGRALQAMIMDLSKPTDEAKRKLYKLGIITHDAAGKMLPMNMILKQLKDSNMSVADSFTLFNRNSARAVTALTRNVDKFSDFQDNIESTTGALDAQSDTIRDSFNKSIDRAKNNIDAIAKSVGDLFLPVLTDMANLFSDIVGYLDNMDFSGFLSFIKEAVKIMAGIFIPGAGAAMAAGAMFGGDEGGASQGGLNAWGGFTGSQQKGTGTGTNRWGAFTGSQAPATRGGAAKASGQKARDEEIADLIDPKRLFKEAIEKFKEKLMLAELQGGEALLDLDVGQTLKTIFSTMLTDLASKADGTALTVSQAFNAVETAFKMAQTTGEAAAFKKQQDDVKNVIADIDRNKKLNQKRIDADADFIEDYARAGDDLITGLEDFASGLNDKLLSGLGKVGSTIKDATEAFATGGAPAALASVFTSLIMESEGFVNILEALDPLFSMLANVMTPFLNLIVPLIEIFDALAPLFEVLGDIIAFALTPILLLVAFTLLTAFSIIAAVWNFIASFLNIFGAGLEIIDIGAAWKNFFKSFDEANSTVDDTTESFEELNRAMVGIAGLPDAIKLNLLAFRAALGDLAQVVGILTGGGPNIGHAHGGQIHRFANGGIVPGQGNQDSVLGLLTPGEMVIPKGMVAANGTTVFINNMVVKVTDVKDFMKKLTNAQEWRSMARSGRPGGPGYMGNR